MNNNNSSNKVDKLSDREKKIVNTLSNIVLWLYIIIMFLMSAAFIYAALSSEVPWLYLVVFWLVGFGFFTFLKAISMSLILVLILFLKRS
jgi:lipopolysaccharide export LptBFGC system permease protein LptF